MPEVSIIIRTRNEERWITSCLESVYRQKFRDFEVILVDNRSTDRTVQKALSWPVKHVNIDDYLPGKAINLGVENSSGRIIVLLSGHCIPVCDCWLENLISNLKNSEVAGVYGRQQPMSFSSDMDKRDLLTVFGLDRRVQIRDSFFHNANSAVRRETLRCFPFDSEVTNIEDRVWGQQVISAGLKLVYEPEASVYHYHGIHQDQDPERRRNVVRILESLQDSESYAAEGSDCVYSAEALNVTALIPVKGAPQICGERPLIDFTIKSALQAEHVNSVVVLTDNDEMAELCSHLGADVPFIRPPELSSSVASVQDVLQYGINLLESEGYLTDICLVMHQSYPFRPDGFIDDLIESFVREGASSMIPMQEEGRAVWRIQEGVISSVSPLMPRHLKKDKLLISHFGLGFVTYPTHLRDGTLGLDNVCMYPVSDFITTLEIRNEKAFESLSEALKS